MAAAEQVYIERLRSMRPEEKLRALRKLCTTARRLKAAFLRAQHPDWEEARIQHTVRQIFMNSHE